MPHLSWAGTPRDHRFASRYARRRAFAVLIVAGVLGAACSGDDDSGDDDPSTQATPVDSTGSTDLADSPTDPSRPTGADASETGDGRASPASDEGGEASEASETPTSTEATSARCGDDIEPSGPVELLVWHGLGGDAGSSYLPRIVGKFQEEHPEITVEFEKADTYYPSGLPQFADPASPTPDVLYGSNLTIRAQADSGRFIPIEQCTGGRMPPQFDGLLPVAEQAYRVDGTLWGAPYNVSTPLLMYDGNVWRDAGLDPDRPPETIDELLETARQLAASRAAATGLVLYNKSALWLITETAAKEGRLLLEPNNGHDVDRVDLARIVTDDVVDLLDELRVMKANEVISWTKENTNDEDLIELITPLEGSAMTLHTSAALGQIFRLQDEGTIDVDVRVAPMPGPGPGANPGGGSWWLTDGDDPDRVAAAWQFIDWMTQPEQIAELAAFTGYVPTTPAAVAHPTTVESWEQHPQLRVAYEQVAATPGTPAAAGIQVGPLVEFYEAIELGAAYTIDVGNDPRTELESAVTNAMNTLAVYNGS